MPTTSSGALRYPASTAAPNVSQDIQNLATDLDQKVIVPVATPTARNALTSGQKYDGMIVYEQSTKRHFRYNLTNSRWEYLAGPWFTWTPTLTTAGGTLTFGGATRGVYIITEGRLKFSCSFQFLDPIDGKSGNISLQMPTGTVARTTEPVSATVAALLYTKASELRWLGGGGAVGATVGLIFQASTTNGGLIGFQNATTPGATGTGVPLVPGSYPLTNNSRLDVWGEYELASWNAL